MRSATLDVENTIRPTALGKKSWLFFGDADAGERSSIIESFAVMGSNPTVTYTMS
jgi:hypothetical protein